MKHCMDMKETLLEAVKQTQTAIHQSWDANQQSREMTPSTVVAKQSEHLVVLAFAAETMIR